MLNDDREKTGACYRGHTFRTEYDPLHRPIHRFVLGADPQDSTKEILFGKMEYGESRADGAELNARTRMFRQSDGAGVVTHAAYDFKGNLLRTTRQLAQDYREAPDWSGTPVLDPDVFTSSSVFDALDRQVAVITPDNSVMRPTYNQANLLKTVTVNLRGAATPTPFVTSIDYDAKGQRALIEYGNGVRSEYEYDPQTFRLTHYLAGKPQVSSDDPTPSAPARFSPQVPMTVSIQRSRRCSRRVTATRLSPQTDCIYALTGWPPRKARASAMRRRRRRGTTRSASACHTERAAMRRYSERAYDAAGAPASGPQAQNGNWTRDYRYLGPHRAGRAQPFDRRRRRDAYPPYARQHHRHAAWR